MSEVVVDASVAVKWFSASGEEHVDRAVALLERHRTGEVALIAPAIMPLEVLNALRRAGIGDRLGLVAEALAGSEIEFVVPCARTLAETARLAAEHDLTAYDASYAALALVRDCPLVSADRRAFADLPGIRVELL